MTRRTDDERQPLDLSAEQQLEARIGGLLRGLPLRPAPESLERRVLAELQRLRSLPWWRHSFSHWPPAARIALVALCTSLAAMGLLAGSVMDQAMHLAGPPARHALEMVALTGELAALFAQFSPPSWFSVVLFAGAALYAGLFGLGALAYRTLYFSPLRGR